MRTLCPNLENENGLETVLEVPIPEESFTDAAPWRTMKALPHSTEYGGGRNAELQLLLGVVGAPLIPVPITGGRHTAINPNINDYPMEASMAKYIVHQYIAATGGDQALNSVDSMFAVGKVKMVASEYIAGDGISMNCSGLSVGGGVMKIKSVRNSGGEMGGFVLWQKRPDLWSLELVVSGCKISAGSDGKVAWRQTPWHQSHASRGPPRPLRRSLQGLDPKATANLFVNSICTGEKTINGEDCFVLKLEVEPSSLKQRSSNNVEIIKHTIWGHFSQRTGLLHHLKDSNLIRIKDHGNGNVFWETTMETLIQDYRTIDGINIAHSGVTTVLLFRFGDHENHSRTKMEEVWTIEELDFNIKGLSMDCFLPPSDLIKGADHEASDVAIGDTRSDQLATKSKGIYLKIGVSKVVDFNPQTFGEQLKDLRA
ncbi:hypothetical protein HanPI659440_Chr15g0616961 [Helianthus annuus]|nr:hypothetical protein HanIR_Chr15g0784601 [Helianthus annuus]KAJ0695158.1 hypothetical protein HanPI659440_Chr15g0616961 [Helianthus annuus]